MYDAKNNSDKESEDIRYNCIQDRCYFSKVRDESMINLKTSHVPVDDIINLQ